MKLKLLASKAVFWCRKNSPKLLIVGAITSFSLSLASAIYSTTKLNKVTKPYLGNIERIRNDLKDPTCPVPVKENRKALALEYGRLVGKLAILYLPSTLFFGTGVACTLGSHKIMSNRNIALAATCATIDNGFKAYRERVKEKLGEEAEEKLYQNISKEKQNIVDPETGKTKAKSVAAPHLNLDEQFNVIFDQSNRNFETNALRNFDFLMCQQRVLNLKLINQGYLFLSDVYDTLGFTAEILGPEKARASHILGWMYDPFDTSKNSFVDFGLCEPGTMQPNKKVKEAIVANEPVFWLSMNVDGDILTGENGKRIFTETTKRGY